MDLDASMFPEMTTFSSVIRYSLLFEEAAAGFYRQAAELGSGKAETFLALAEKHDARYKLLEETRQQKLNEMILEPISGLDREKYIPEIRAVSSEEEAVETGRALEDLAVELYQDIAEIAVELSREASKVYKRMAKENGKLKARL